MKTINRTYMPDAIYYMGKELKFNTFISGAMSVNRTNPKTIINTLKKEGRVGVLVNVLSRNLRGKTDLYNQPYKPQQYIYSN